MYIWKSKSNAVVKSSKTAPTIAITFLPNIENAKTIVDLKKILNMLHAR